MLPAGTIVDARRHAIRTLRALTPGDSVDTWGVTIDRTPDGRYHLLGCVTSNAVDAEKILTAHGLRSLESSR